MKINAYVSRKGNPYVLEEVEMRTPGKGEVVVKIKAASLCHTDFGILQLPNYQEGVIAGHEACGVVYEVGEGVTKVAVGDKVVLAWDFCGECEPCRIGQVHNCTSYGVLNGAGKTTPDGRTKYLDKDGNQLLGFMQAAYAEYTVVPERTLIKADPEIKLEALAPLACGIQTGCGTVIDFLRPSYRDSLLISGVGTVGLSAVMGAKLINVGTIIAVDINKKKLALAKELGADIVIDSTEVEDVATEVKKLNGGLVKYALDTTNIESVVHADLASLGLNGVLVAVAMGPPFSLFPVRQLIYGQKSITSLCEGGVNPHNIIPYMIKKFKEGNFPFDKLLSYHEFKDLATVAEGFKKGETIKPILVLSD